MKLRRTKSVPFLYHPVYRVGLGVKPYSLSHAWFHGNRHEWVGSSATRNRPVYFSRLRHQTSCRYLSSNIYSNICTSKFLHHFLLFAFQSSTIPLTLSIA